MGNRALVTPLDKAAAQTFRTLSRLRGKRVVHPQGPGFEAILTISEEGASIVRAGIFSEAGKRDAVVRLSRGAGLPGSLPDVLGLAFRVPDAYGPDAHQDFLLVSSAAPPVFRHAILPGPRGFFAHTYSSVAPYEAQGTLLVFGARCVDGGESPAGLAQVTAAAQGREFEILAARPRGAWHRIASLAIGERLPASTTEALRLNPWNTSDDLRPRGPFMRLRDPAYRGSQAGRGAALT